MPRRLIALLTLALALGPGGCNRIASGPQHGSASKHSNLLLVTIDTLRADHLGAYGAEGAQTPTLDGLAAEGVRFDAAIASAPLTLPSHASILTGLYPPALGVRHNGVYRLDPAFETLAERLRREGWATGSVVGAFVLHRSTGLDQGFDFYDDATSTEKAGPGGFLERKAEAVTERALAWLATAPRPFFLWVHYYDPHARYQPPSPFAEAFAERPYDGEIAYVDAQLGRLVETLRARGELDRTLVIATSDHGESLGEHDEADHGYGLYDAVLAVPLVLRGPGVPAGGVVADVVRTVDVLPTALALLGVPAPEGIDGADLGPLWSGSAPRLPRLAYAETLAPQLELGWAPLFAVRDARFLYVRAPRPELYDTTTDPSQVRNLLEEPDALGQGPAQRLEAAVGAVLAHARNTAPRAIEPDALARLQALGYALPADPALHAEPEPDALDPKHGRRLLGLIVEGTHAYEADQLERARSLLERAVRELPRSSRAHAQLAFLYLHEQQPEQALAHLEAAVQYNPLSAHYRAMLAETRRQLGDAEGALRDFEAAASLDPDEPEARIGLMWAALRSGDVESAEEHARRAAARSSSSADVLAHIGDTWSQARQHARAGAAFEAAVRLDPTLAYAQMRLAIELARFGQEAASERHRFRAGSLAHDPLLWTRLALAHADSGKPERAEAMLHDILEREPGYTPAERALARIQH